MWEVLNKEMVRERGGEKDRREGVPPRFLPGRKKEKNSELPSK